MLMRRYGSLGMSVVGVLFLFVGLMPVNAEAMALNLLESSSPQIQNFPIRDRISFSSQYINELFILTDGSMWIITGVSDNYSTGRGEKNLTIYAGTDALPQPEAGAKSGYFMLIEGNSTTYFVKPLPPQTQIINDRIDFSSQYIDELLVLTNGSMWIITGVSDNYSTGSGEKNFKIYAGTDVLPQPEAGTKSGYFMLIEGGSTTYFVAPLLPQTQIINDQIDFSSQYINELFILTDGSMWIITGVSDNYSTGRGEKNLTIYAGTDALPQPEAGAKSGYFMLIEGNSTTYFVKPLPPQTQIINDRIDFSSQYIDELLVLTNGSMWIITGVSDNYSTGSGEKNLKIYAGTDALPQPEAGTKSDYFMLIEGNSTTYFVNPLSPIFSLSVSKTGNGTVTSSPAGINCGTTCSAGFSSGASVTLTAAPATADATITWSGCTPVATNPRQCTVSMTSNQTVTANFASTPSRQVTVPNIDGAVGSQRFFKIIVPAGAANLIIGTDGGSGNPNLYVKAGAKPQTAAADCASVNAGTTEQCLLQAPQTGLPYYILLDGESSYSGVTLRVSWNP